MSKLCGIYINIWTRYNDCNICSPDAFHYYRHDELSEYDKHSYKNVPMKIRVLICLSPPVKRCTNGIPYLCAVHNMIVNTCFFNNHSFNIN